MSPHFVQPPISSKFLSCPTLPSFHLPAPHTWTTAHINGPMIVGVEIVIIGTPTLVVVTLRSATLQQSHFGGAV